MKFIRNKCGYEYRVESKFGDPFDCFFSFVEWQGELWSVHRRHSMFPPHLWPKSYENYISDVVVTQWKRDQAGDLIVHSSDIIGRGNDPRLAMIGGRPIALFRGGIHSDHEYYSYDFALKRLVSLQTNEPGFVFGKNWSPFEVSGRLRAIHGLEPLKVLSIDSNTGNIVTSQTHHHPIRPKSHDQYSMLRGGTNAIVHDHYILGLGHATFAPWHHYPFCWSIGSDNQLEIAFNQELSNLTDAGFNIVDPTSIHCDHARNYWLGLCISERDWFFEQTFFNLLITADLDAEASPPRFRINTDNLELGPYCRWFPAEGLASEVLTESALYGGRTILEPGFGLVGPFTALVSGRYEIRVRYRAPAREDIDVGRIDLGLSIPGHYSEVRHWNLRGTNDQIMEFCAEFSWNPTQGEFFAMRMRRGGAVPVTAYDLRICELDRK